MLEHKAEIWDRAPESDNEQEGVRVAWTAINTTSTVIGTTGTMKHPVCAWHTGGTYTQYLIWSSLCKLMRLVHLSGEKMRQRNHAACPSLNSKKGRWEDRETGTPAPGSSSPSARCLALLHYATEDHEQPAGRSVQRLEQLWLNFYLCCCRRKNKTLELSVYLWGRPYLEIFSTLQITSCMTLDKSLWILIFLSPNKGVGQNQWFLTCRASILHNDLRIIQAIIPSSSVFCIRLPC